MSDNLRSWSAATRPSILLIFSNASDVFVKKSSKLLDGADGDIQKFIKRKFYRCLRNYLQFIALLVILKLFFDVYKI